MSSVISGNYRELSSTEVDQVAAELASAWQSAEIPMRQYEACVKSELAAFREYTRISPFEALISCVRSIGLDRNTTVKLLDVGCSSGYYREVLKIRGYEFDYTGLDYSPTFKELAERLYPGIQFQVADAAAIPFPENCFDIVLSGACIMHSANYAQIIKELVRVSDQYVILHRTPFITQGPTRVYEKEAYGVRCLEFHFSESELLSLCHNAGLQLLHTADIFWDAAEQYGHRTYLFRKFEMDYS